MTPLDFLGLSLSNLWKRRLRTALTVVGVTIGIGALFSMFAFGKGVQKNVSDTFDRMELFNYIMVFSDSFEFRSGRGGRRTEASSGGASLDERAVAAIERLKGVERVFPDVRFPARVKWGGREEFVFVQALPVGIVSSNLIKLRAGRPYASEDEYELILSDALLHRLGVTDPEEALGISLTVATLTLDFSAFSPGGPGNLPVLNRLPFSSRDYRFTVVGVAERMGFGGATPLRSDVFVPYSLSRTMSKLDITSLWELFRSRGLSGGFGLLNVRLSSPTYADSVQSDIRAMGFGTFAFIDQMEEVKTGFRFMDMFLAAVGMIAIVVASLGIVNTMLMSILERTREIGIMKAVGAEDGDIRNIFFFESGLIGLAGGFLGVGLGRLVSTVINRVVNYFFSRQGVPFIDYFTFPWWLCLGSILFAVAVSLAAGIYPAIRAARVDPVVALRHD